ncbi:Phage integrase [Caballeronia concitans]|uniref:Phage integrase n=1 Tax=Caballeronia concitans TaxID=1777133 RepID=A0A658R5P7_9BURK|nr:Phage integrase [Caballeronia concitans]
MGQFFVRRDADGALRWWLNVHGKGDKQRLVPANVYGRWRRGSLVAQSLINASAGTSTRHAVMLIFGVHRVHELGPKFVPLVWGP